MTGDLSSRWFGSSAAKSKTSDNLKTGATRDFSTTGGSVSGVETDTVLAEVENEAEDGEKATNGGEEPIGEENLVDKAIHKIGTFSNLESIAEDETTLNDETTQVNPDYTETTISDMAIPLLAQSTKSTDVKVTGNAGNGNSFLSDSSTVATRSVLPKNTNSSSGNSSSGISFNSTSDLGSLIPAASPFLFDQPGSVIQEEGNGDNSQENTPMDIVAKYPNTLSSLVLEGQQSRRESSKDENKSDW